MNEVTVHFLGSGDAFGSGGRLQSCIFVDTGSFRFLLDCGPSVLPAGKRFGVPIPEIDAILLSHLHGDHYGGVPFVLLEARLVERRSAPLIIAGPPGTAGRIDALGELLFPGTMTQPPPFPLAFIEFGSGTPAAVGDALVTAFPALHQADPPSFALRIACGGRVIGYSGDSAWTDGLRHAADGADLFICECFQFDASVGNHLDYRTLMAHRDELACRRLVITHMGREMLGHLDSIDISHAHDGMVITL